MIQELNGTKPQIGEGTFLAPSAQIIGDVQIGKKCSIWYGAILRGDVFPIRIGDETNVQDGSVLHGTYKKCGVTLGKRVTIGHSV
ncbi:MAG: gamma carbonic anhydrase family protein, partial [Bdellovibrionales bacterium]|nr:gamma carbonic anhydrase family protein [Bdellovibrionales bacterium]